MRDYSSLDQLPATLPVFPLTGAVLLPRGQLPLNIFESRYIAMVDAALAGARFIGMIQPTEHEDTARRPPLSKVGCAGVITSFRDSDDARYMIVLSGVCRFRIGEELAVSTPFRQVRPDYSSYLGDLVANGSNEFPRQRLIGALKGYLAQRDLKADWDSVMSAPPETLVNALAMLCPFGPAEKQALIEAPGWKERVETLMVLLRMASAPATGNSSLN